MLNNQEISVAESQTVKYVVIKTNMEYGNTEYSHRNCPKHYRKTKNSLNTFISNNHREERKNPTNPKTQSSFV